MFNVLDDILEIIVAAGLVVSLIPVATKLLSITTIDVQNLRIDIVDESNFFLRC
jgi:hypothetical protein